MAKNIKIGIITSRGGHLYQIYRIKNFWKNYDRFWVTFPGEDTNSLLRREKKYFGYFPESRNLLNAIKNLFLAMKILSKEKPQYLLSCGAGIAPPFFLVAKVLKIKTVFIEPYDFIDFPSLSGRILSLFVDKYLVQHKTQIRFSRKAEYWGSTF